MTLLELTQPEPVFKAETCTHPNAKVLIYNEKNLTAYVGCNNCGLDYARKMTSREIFDMKEKNIFQ